MPAIEPLPYCPSLAKTLHGPTLALVLTYLEIHHPAQQEPKSGNSALKDAPLIIDCDIVCDALGVSRRTLHIAFSCLGCWWSTEDDRGRAARAGREFLNPKHSLGPSGHDPVKIYSFTGSRAYAFPRKLAMRRNYSKLVSLFSASRLIPLDFPCLADERVCASLSTVRVLPEILERALVTWGDRRADRWDRWRRLEGRKPTNVKRMRQARSSLDVGNPSE